MTLLPEHDAEIDPRRFVEPNHRVALVGAQHDALEVVIDALSETEMPPHALAHHDRLAVAPQIETQRVFGDVEQRELTILEVRDRPGRQRIDDPELGPLLFHYPGRAVAGAIFAERQSPNR